MKSFLDKTDYFAPAIAVSLAVHSLLFSVAIRMPPSPDFSVAPGEQSVEFVVLGEDAPSVMHAEQKIIPDRTFPQLPVQNDGVDVLPDDVKGLISSDTVVDRKSADRAQKPLSARIRDAKISKVEEMSPIDQPADQSETRLHEVVVHAASSDTVEQGVVVQGVLKDSDNTAPRYPHLAREHGWEGVVYIKAFVQQDGAASKVIIEKSSGYNVLDAAARTSVENWYFKAARDGQAVLSSWVDIPVRFRLIDQPEEK